MARKVITTVLDDIDGSDDAETVTFSYENKLYEIDLSDSNKKKLEDALEPFISAARSAGGSARRSTSAPRGGGRTDLAAIRAWAKDNGHDVSDRGRVPASVIEAYDANH